MEAIVALLLECSGVMLVNCEYPTGGGNAE
jgi:hypothetical protein